MLLAISCHLHERSLMKSLVVILGIGNQLAVLLIELLAIVTVFVYLLDKGWGIILAAIITLSVIGTIITMLVAAFGDGYWWPLLLGIAGITVAVVGSLLVGGLAEVAERIDH